MIRIKKWSTWLCLCLGLVGIRYDAEAQLTNPSFETYCGSTIGSCPTFTNTCVPGWYRSHGSPQIITSGGADGNNYAAMWSKFNTYGANNSLQSEGVFAYHQFHKYRSYRVCFWVRNDVNIGALVIWIANGIPQLGDNQGGCGQTEPNVNHQTVFSQTPSWSGGWTKVTFSFTASEYFEQILFFPYNGSESTTLWVNIDDIQISEICSPDIVFNMTTNTTSGKVNHDYYVGANIYAGSSAGGGSLGAGTVFSDPNAHVTFEGGNTVVLSPNFIASPNGGQQFHAYINPCSDTYCGGNTFLGNTEGIQGNEQDPYTDYEEGGGQPPVAPKQNNPNEQSALDAGVMVYPNPTNGVLRIVSNTNSACTYEITTVAGQVLKTGTAQSGEAINIAEYATGIYLIKVTTANAKTLTTHKIVKE